MRHIRMLALVAVALVTPLEANAWQIALSGDRPFDLDTTANAVAFAPDGDVVATGDLTEVAANRFVALQLMRFDGDTGRVRWTAVLGDDDESEGVDVYVGDDGGVVVGGRAGVPSRAFVAEVDGDTGATRWTRLLDGSPAGAFTTIIAVAPAGDDVVALGGLPAVPNAAITTVAKLDGDTGAELWRRTFSGTAGGFALPGVMAVDGAGDVVVGGMIQNVGTEDDFFVAKVAGATGAVLWSVVIADPPSQGPSTASDVVVDAAGDVIVSGHLASEDFVAKLDGASGAELWRHTHSTRELTLLALDAGGDVFAVSGTAAERLASASGTSLWTATLPARANALAVATDGDLLAAGHQSDQLVIVRLAGPTGARDWIVTARGRSNATIEGQGDAKDIAVHPVRGIAVAGQLTSRTQRTGLAYEDFFAVWAFDERLAGRKATVLDPPGNPASRRLAVVVNDGLSLGPLPSVATDPRQQGGALTLVNTITNATATFPLPASGWSVQGEANLKAKYTYKDPRHDFGPCKSLVLQQGRKLTLTCDGPSLGFDLAGAASAGALGVVVRVAEFRHCLVFGGDVTSRGNGRFQLQDAPAPGACPDAP